MHKLMGRTQTGFTEVYAQSLSADCVTLTFDLATSFLFATHRLVMLIICVKLFSNPLCMAKLRPGHESGTHTHTHGQDKL